MKDLAMRFLGKECIVYTLNSQTIGTVREVSDAGILLEKEDSVEIVNLSYTVRIREYPKTKNGKKKSVFVG